MQWCRPKHWQKLAPKKNCIEVFVMNFFEQKSLLKLKHRRQYLNALRKSIVQKSCPKHRQKNAKENRPKLNARQNVIVEKFYPKNRYKLLLIKTKPPEIGRSVEKTVLKSPS